MEVRMQEFNALYLMTKVYSNLKHKGNDELALPIEFFYKRYSHAHLKDKQRVFDQFIEYCNDYDINIHEDYIADMVNEGEEAA